MDISFGRWGCLRIGTAERHSLERGVGGSFVLEFALKQHDFKNREGIAFSQ
jgi:hypothetical protein